MAQGNGRDFLRRRGPRYGALEDGTVAAGDRARVRQGHSSIRCLVSRHGGIVPAVRWRSLLALNRDLNEIVSQIGGHAFPALCRGLVWG